MAIYHLTAKFVKRSSGQSAVAKAAYNAHDKLENHNTGERHNYRHKGEVAFSGIFAPKDAPEWAQDLVQNREVLWSTVEQRETRKNSQLAKEIEIALPHELTDQQREFLVKDFVRENFVRKGVIADVSIHAPSKDGDERNHHSHILMTTREINQEGFGEKQRHLNTKEQLLEWREKWEHLVNRHLERHGHTARIDHRSLEAQGLDRVPTIHIGPTATDFEREGVKTDRGDLNRQIKTLNRAKAALKKREEKTQQPKDKRDEKAPSKGRALGKAGDKMSGAASKAGNAAGRLTNSVLSIVPHGKPTVDNSGADAERKYFEIK